MVFASLGAGTATISSTSAGPGGSPSITITDTGSFTATAFVTTSIRTVATDIKGDIGIYWTRVDDDSATFYATRQLPAGDEIVFDWHASEQ